MSTIKSNLYAVLTRLRYPLESFSKAESVSEGQFFVLSVAKEEISAGAVSLNGLSQHSRDTVENVHGRRVGAYNNWFSSVDCELESLKNVVSYYLADRKKFLTDLEQLTFEQIKYLREIFKKFIEPIPGYISFYMNQESCATFRILNRFVPTFKEIKELCDVVLVKMEIT